MITINQPVSWFGFNAAFNNSAVISWRSVLLVEETGVLWENHWPVVNHWQTVLHNAVSSKPRHKRGSKLTTLAMIVTDCTGCCKSNYHTTTITTTPLTSEYMLNMSSLFFFFFFLNFINITGHPWRIHDDSLNNL
jgi:hypothetical protein